MRPLIFITPDAKFSRESRDNFREEAKRELAGTRFEGAVFIFLPEKSESAFFGEFGTVLTGQNQ